MSIITAAEIGRQHLGQPVAVDAPISDDVKHVEGTLRWFAHHEAGLVVLGIESPRTGITHEWQLLSEVPVALGPAHAGATWQTAATFPPASYVVLGWSSGPGGEPRIWMGRQFATRMEAAVFAEETAARSADWSGKPWAFAVARVSVIEDDPHDVPDEDIEGGASNGE